MVHKKMRGGMLLGLAAAAMVSAATAPAARANDFTEIIDNVQATIAAGQADFSSALSDFGGGLSGVPDGLEELAAAVNNDSVATEEALVVGVVNALTNEPVEGGPFALPALTAPTDFTLALTEAQGYFLAGQLTSDLVGSDLAKGEFGNAAFAGLEGAFISYDLPVEQILNAGIDQLLGL